jgi:hypothetical protein
MKFLGVIAMMMTASVFAHNGLKVRSKAPGGNATKDVMKGLPKMKELDGKMVPISATRTHFRSTHLKVNMTALKKVNTTNLNKMRVSKSMIAQRAAALNNLSAIMKFLEAQPGGGGCVPLCTWKCSTPSCTQVCEPECDAPKCETRCQMDTSGCSFDCKDPSCAVSCPDGGCTNECPKCVANCGKPHCMMNCPEQPCKSVCEQPQCRWNCRAPDVCPEPDCHMACDTPKACTPATSFQALPGLAPGERTVSTYSVQHQGR